MKFLISVALLVICGLTEGTRHYDNLFANNIELPPPLYFQNYREKHYPNARIVGGEEAVPNSLPYQVALITEFSTGRAFCGGSLIRPDVVLTAAHCIDGATGPTEVILGPMSVLEEEATQVIYSTSDRIIHPEWSSLFLVNDIALVFLPENVTLNENINLITLPSNADNLYTDELALASGWGKPSDASSTISPVLREVNVTVLSNAVCGLVYFGVIQDSHICTSGANGRGTCSGDSGGPLVYQGVQIGIVSFGVSFGCEIGFPSAYTRVTSFLDWIDSNASRL